jgi:ADP-heptose:LPS heptosyltransferase
MSLKQSAKSLSAGLLLSAERLLRGKLPTSIPDKVSSVLILEYMLPLGCCVHLTPLYEAIKHFRPEVTVTVATRALGLALLRHHPFVDHLIETPDPLSSTFLAAQSLAAQMAKLNLQPDCALTGASDQRTRIALLGLLSGARWRGGYTQSPQLYQRPLTLDPHLSQIDNNLRLAALAGCPIGHLEPRVFFSPADLTAAQALALEANPQGKPLLVMVTQNSGGQSTGWHNDRFIQVIRHAHEALGCSIAYVGTATDTAAVEQLRQDSGGIGTIVAGRTSVTELAALLALSDAAISLDTGTAHIARAVGVPFAILGPSWQKPIEWLPLGLPQARILRGPDSSGVPPNYKLDEITADEVIAALDDLLRTYPPSPTSRQARLQRSSSSIGHHLRPSTDLRAL